MSIDRTLLVGGPAKVTFNSGTFHSREDIRPKFNVDFGDVVSSVHGPIDKHRKDRRVTIPVRLWGAWENLSILFPSTYLTPTIGSRIYSTTDLPLVLHSTNTDIFTFANARLTKLANLHLGVDQPIFSGDCEFTALIGNTKNPEDAGAYYAITSGAYADATFAKTNFKTQRYSSAWGAISGFAAFQARDGWDIEWELMLEPETINAVGTVGYILMGLVARAKCIPVEPTSAQVLAASYFQDTGGALGGLLSANSADLVCTGSGVSVTLKNAGILEHAHVWGAKPLRNGELVWETTVAFTAGVAQARAVIA